MAPLVFKTSLGIVRSPEGSTPSLLRHKMSLNLKWIYLLVGINSQEIEEIGAKRAQTL